MQIRKWQTLNEYRTAFLVFTRINRWILIKKNATCRFKFTISLTYTIQFIEKKRKWFFKSIAFAWILVSVSILDYYLQLPLLDSFFFFIWTLYSNLWLNIRNSKYYCAFCSSLFEDASNFIRYLVFYDLGAKLNEKK